jgi:hypothetical protein
MAIQIPTIQKNGRGDCENIRNILESIKEYFPTITDEWFCDLAEIERSTLSTWRKEGNAKGQNVQNLIDRIKEMPDNWDPELEVGDCVNSSVNWK